MVLLTTLKCSFKKGVWFEWAVIKKLFLPALSKSGTVGIKCLMNLQLLEITHAVSVPSLCSFFMDGLSFSLETSTNSGPFHLNCPGLWESKHKSFATILLANDVIVE